MHILSTIQDTKNCLSNLKKSGKKIGFVPTMGALHQGHLALLERAKIENDILVSSIFVNPLQFNDKKDLDKYPRTLNKDIEVLQKAHCDVLFVPSSEEMYPPNQNPNLKETPDNILTFSADKKDLNFDLGYLDTIMEGKHRPGHFAGVCTVVRKLFDIIKPAKAYFGEKDFQQLTIIRYMVSAFNIPVEIISCSTIREPDGLAMSSRNILLTTEEKKNASHIFRTLSEAKEKRSNTSVPDLQKWVIERINQNSFMQLEYFEIVNSETLLPVSSWDEAKNIRACIAVKTGAVRLIDNIPM